MVTHAPGAWAAALTMAEFCTWLVVWLGRIPVMARSSGRLFCMLTTAVTGEAISAALFYSQWIIDILNYTKEYSWSGRWFN
jgi:hypothetical protein